MSSRLLLEQRGLEATPRRAAVVDALALLDHAPSAPELLDAVRHSVQLDKVTLYRTLDLLVEVGLVRRHAGGDSVFRYCLVADTAPVPHPHFFCTRCKRMSCLPALDMPLADALQLPAGQRAERIELRVDGICPTCDEAAFSIAPPSKEN